MNEVLTAAVTVLLGLVVLVAGQIAQRFFIEPIQEQRKFVGEIASLVVLYGNVGEFSQPETRLEAQATLRKLAGQLRSTLWTIPCYRLFQSLGWVEERERVLTASQNLVGWSNAVVSERGGTEVHRKAIIDALRLPPS